MYQSLVTPNTAIKAKAGMCLSFTEDVWGTPHLYPSATKAYNATKFRHTDALPNVPVPVWFQSYGAYGTPAVWDNWGHVATYIPGKGVLSSPITFVGPGQQSFSSVEELVAAINKVLPKSNTKYLGWSEDLANVRLVRGASMDRNKLAEAVSFMYLATATGDKPEGYGTQSQIDYWTDRILKSPDAIDELAQALYKHPKNLEMRYKAFNPEGGYPALVIQVADLKKQLAEKPAGNIPSGTYLKVEKSNVIEVK